MKLNHDCIRDILISVESINYGEVWTINNLTALLPQYTEEELQYHCVKPYEAGYLDAITTKMMRSPEQVARILDLTYPGHQFLADIRSDNTWNRTKEIAGKIGAGSLSSIKEIATGVIATLIQQQLGQH